MPDRVPGDNIDDSDDDDDSTDSKMWQDSLPHKKENYLSNILKYIQNSIR